MITEEFNRRGGARTKGVLGETDKYRRSDTDPTNDSTNDSDPERGLNASQFLLNLVSELS